MVAKSKRSSERTDESYGYSQNENQKIKEASAHLSHIATRHNPENRLKAIFKELEPQQCEIIKLRFGIGDRSHTLAECAAIFKMTKANIRRTQMSALWRMCPFLDNLREIKETSVLLTHIAINRQKPKSDLKDVLKDLTPRHRRIIHLRFGIGCEPYTLEECAAIFEITRERVRQLQNTALRRICLLSLESLRQIAGPGVEEPETDYILTKRVD